MRAGLALIFFMPYFYTLYYNSTRNKCRTFFGFYKPNFLRLISLSSCTFSLISSQLPVSNS